MDDKRFMLRHFLAALAYRTQKALRGAPASFGNYRAEPGTRTPHELVWHMDSVLGYALTKFEGGTYREPSLPTFAEDVERFHGKLEQLREHLEQGTPFVDITPERLLQGPFADAMTHAGQLAMLRRLAGSPVRPEDFVYADINPENVSADQPEPARPDKDWPEAPENLRKL